MTYESESLRRAIRAGIWDTNPVAHSRAVLEVYRLEREAEGQPNTMVTYESANRLCGNSEVVCPSSN